MSKQPKRVLDTAAKQALLLRHASGETLGRLARETGILRKSLYEWRDAYRAFGIAGLNRKRGPKPGPRKLRPLAEPVAKGSHGELAKARVKIAELERKIGQQALDIDFFHKALRALDAADRQGSIAPVSRKSSKS